MISKAIVFPLVPEDRQVPWLEQCSTQWKFLPVKYLCRINARTLTETTPPDYAFQYIDISNVDSQGQYTASEPMIFADAPSRARRILVDGDVLISTVRTYLRSITQVKKPEDLICSTGFAVLSSGSSIDPGFLAYWVRCSFFVDEVVARSKGVSYPAVNASDIASLPLPALDLKFQKRIASFLDRETARIDSLIEKKERQIELLHEKRSSLITHTVINGLNPKVRMQASGQKWFANIPSHWKVRKLKHIASAQLSSVDKLTEEGEVPVSLCNYTDVYNNDTIHEDMPFMQATATSSEIARFSLSEDDVLVTKDSESWTDIAVPAFVPKNIPSVLCGYHLAQIRAKRNILHGKYLFYSFCARGINDQFRVESTGVTRYGLGKYSLDNGLFPLPPLKEQEEIASYLDMQINQMDFLLGKTHNSIATLREYRSALITAAVTGKIDVREEAPV